MVKTSTLVLIVTFIVSSLLALGVVWRYRPEQVRRFLMPLWVRTVPDRPYGGHPENRVDLMLPRWSLRRHRPAVLVFHGGGWKSGDRQETRSTVCRRYVGMGFLVGNVEYRLGAIPAAAEDAQAALRWFMRTAPDYGADPGRIVVTGISAGSHLALLAAFRSAAPVAAVVNFYGPSNLEVLLANPAVQEGLPADVVLATARQMSPTSYIRTGLPPVFSVHGTADELVPASQTAALTESLRAAGNDASALFIDGGHGFSRPQQDRAYDAVFAFLRQRRILLP